MLVLLLRALPAADAPISTCLNSSALLLNKNPSAGYKVTAL